MSWRKSVLAEVYLALSALVIGIGPVHAGAAALPRMQPASGATPYVSIARPAASGPAARDDMGLADDAATGHVVLFGGYEFGTIVGDTWTWDGSAWTEQHPSISPGPRCLMAMTYDETRHQVVLFGGGNQYGSLDDTWTWDGVDWTEQHPQTSPPGADKLEMAYDAATHLVVLFLGDGSTWSWDGSNWTEDQPPNPPPGRGSGAMARFGENVLLFGGVQGSIEDPVYYNDTWAWDGSTWTQLRPALRPPSPRAGMGVAYDQQHRRVVIFGGEHARGVLGTTWTWNGTSWVRWVLDQSPTPRSGSGMTYDSTRREVLLFGGFNGATETGDTWIWSGSSWTCVAGCA